MGWPMHSVYLKCECCDAVVDRRAKDDFSGANRKTVSHGVFAVGEHVQLRIYARSLGWSIVDDGDFCPAHKPEVEVIDGAIVGVTIKNVGVWR